MELTMTLAGTVTIANTPDALKAVDELRILLLNSIDALEESEVNTGDTNEAFVDVYVRYAGEITQHTAEALDIGIGDILKPFLLKAACFSLESNGKETELYIGSPEQIAALKSNEALDEIKGCMQLLSVEDMDKAKAFVTGFAIKGETHE